MGFNSVFKGLKYGPIKVPCAIAGLLTLYGTLALYGILITVETVCCNIERTLYLDQSVCFVYERNKELFK